MTIADNSHVDALFPDLLFMLERFVLLRRVREAVLTAVRGQRHGLGRLVRRLPVRLCGETAGMRHSEHGLHVRYCIRYVLSEYDIIPQVAYMIPLQRYYTTVHIHVSAYTIRVTAPKSRTMTATG